MELTEGKTSTLSDVIYLAGLYSSAFYCKMEHKRWEEKV